jgi:25S rRNA (uracil2634-N3)-methyltransferase
VAFFKNALLSLANSTPASTSSIIVTLFEGEPYTLWNIRDLARHSELQVEKSFRFQANAYPGYKHARTLGVVKSKNGESGGGWKGEERSSRSYVFVRKGEATLPGNGAEGRRKKDESSEDEEEFQDGNGNNDDVEVWDGIQEPDENHLQEEVDDV